MPTLRAATPADCRACVDVMVASRRTFIPYAPLVHGDEENLRWMAGLIARGGVTVACRGADPVGVLVVDSDDGAGWIEQLYLAPGHTAQGIGHRLLAHALEILPRALPIRLYTFQANTGARRFYERHGFEAIAFGDGSENEEHCPDVLYELGARTILK